MATAPYTFACNTVGPATVNFSVRDGDGCFPRGKIPGFVGLGRRGATRFPKRGLPDLIIVALRMHEMSGLQIAPSFAGHFPHLPTFAMSEGFILAKMPPGLLGTTSFRFL